MAGFDEQIVREYFELHGFLVRQLRKYQVQARRKTVEEEIDLVVYNPSFVKSDRGPDFFLFSNELARVQRAVVAVKGWHTAVRFTPSTLRNSAEIFSFLEKTVLKRAEDLFVTEDDEDPTTSGAGLLKILVLPGLPVQEPHRSECVRLLRERGVDAILSFRSMLLELVQKVETNRNYQKSETLQILRILKNYDLIKEPQLDLFPRGRKE